jgi:PAS domain S-box-containing protein
MALEERRRAEAGTAELAAIVQSSEDAIVSMTPEGRILTWNRGAERLFGHTAAQAIGQPIALVYPPGEEFVFRRNLEAIRQGERHYEAQRARRDGSTVAVSVTAFPIHDPAGGIAGIGAIYRDITQRKQAQEELQRSLSRQRELSRRLIEAEETERRNINRELHDRIGQNLATLNLNVGMMRSQLPGEILQAVAPRMNDTQKLLADTMGHVRDLMAELHPVALDDYGLVAALRTHAAEFSRRFATAVSVSGSDPAPRLPLTVETALFRIAQEALNNVTKHAYATNVEIRVEAEKGGLVLSITDNGQGFDRKQLGDTRSWGMTTMRERAQAVGAVLAVESAPGFGTRVEVRVSRGGA